VSGAAGVVDALRLFDTCRVANAIETFDVRLRNEGYTNGSIRCLFPERSPVAGYAVTARIRTATPPPVGHVYRDRTDWWSYIREVPFPRFVVVQDVDERPGAGAFIGEVHANILRALGCVAVMTNGAVRDVPAVRELGLQMFAASLSPSHAFAHVLDFGEPVDVAGLHVASGALLHADCHGVVAVPDAVAADIPRVVADMRARERRVIALCRSPEFTLDELRSLVRAPGWEASGGVSGGVSGEK
jgi:regulator of RNase E activity RraA